MKKIYLFFLFIFIATVTFQAQSPRFAAGYPENGIVQTPLGKGDVDVYDALIQSDDKILIIGGVRREVWINNAFNFKYFDYNYLIVRFTQDGRLDSSFAENGILSLEQAQVNSYFYKIKQAPAGHYFALGANNQHIYLYKITQNGQVDVTFGTEGFVEVAQPDEGLSLTDFVITRNGSIAICGTNREQLIIRQYTASGEADAQMGIGGEQRISFSVNESEVNPLVIKSHQDSMLLIGGSIGPWASIIRLHTNGSLDESFAQQGLFRLDAELEFGEFRQLHIFEDGRFYAGGQWDYPGKEAFFANLLPDGRLDSNSLWSSPLVTIPSDLEESMRSMVVSDQGEIFYQSFFRDQLFLSKLNPQAERDSSFGYQGQSIIQIENLACFGGSVMLTQAGNIRLAAMCRPEIGLVQLDSRGNLDSRFYGLGYNIFPVQDGGASFWHIRKRSDNSFTVMGHFFNKNIENNLIDELNVMPQSMVALRRDNRIQDFNTHIFSPSHASLCYDVAVKADGSYFIGGINFGSDIFGSGEPFLVKMLPSGVRDTSFGDQGMAIFPTSVLQKSIHTKSIRAICVLASGKIILASTAGRIADRTFGQTCLLGLLPNGQIDTTFFDQGILTEIALPSLGVPTQIIEKANGNLLIGQRKGRQVNFSGISGLGIVEIIDNAYFNSFEKNNSQGGITFSEGANVTGGKLALNSSGYILQAGSVAGSFKLIQFDPVGRLNLSFGTEGIQSLKNEAGALIFSDFLIAPNDNVLLLGYLDNKNTRRYEGAIACFDAFGNLKTDFGENGLFTFSWGQSYTFPEDIELDEAGNLWIAGSAGGQAFLAYLLSDLNFSTPGTGTLSTIENPFIYPNPISSSTKIRYSLATESDVLISLCDLQGRKVVNLWQGRRWEGEHEQSINFGDDIAPGYYLIRLTTNDQDSYVKVTKN